VRHLPAIYRRFAEVFPDVHRAQEELARACYAWGPLDERSARLVKLAVAIGAESEGAVRSHTRRALADGHSADEIRHVAVLALTTLGFPHTVAAIGWIEEVLAIEIRADSDEDYAAGLD
jgi:alkylhydroperoxidase/carboxymuconolactone decarboxylase family protein YurZ